MNIVHFISIIMLMVGFSLNGQNYTPSVKVNSDGTLTTFLEKDVIHNYLNRAICLQSVSDLNTPQLEAREDLDMVKRIGAKFVSRVGGWWQNTSDEYQMNQYFMNIKSNVDYLHEFDPEIICSSAIFEVITTETNATNTWNNDPDQSDNFHCPKWVDESFGEGQNNNNYIYSTEFNHWYRDFEMTQMTYSNNPTTSVSTPDITKKEAQKWFYYLAVRYIDAGCESIHFGDIQLMTINDSGNKILWSVLEKIRNYAKSKARRNFVLCYSFEANNKSPYYDANLPIQTKFQDRPLLWDFFSLGLYYTPSINSSSICPCNDNNCTTPFNSCNYAHKVILSPSNPNNRLWQKSPGGKNPNGWSTAHNPYLLEFDHGASEKPFGCSNINCNTSPPTFKNSIVDWANWKMDNLTLFATQPSTYRDNLLKYSYYKLKCDDYFAHLEVIGRRKTVIIDQGSYLELTYRAINSTTFQNHPAFSQESIIKTLWSDQTNQSTNPSVWTYRNFTFDFILQPNNPPNVSKSVIYGNNKIYYISTPNNWIEGYIKYNDVWVTVSPSYGNNISINSQVKAKSDLVLDQSESNLYYLGSDNKIYNQKIEDSFNYTYNTLSNANNAMSNDGVTCLGSIVMIGDDRLFFIGKKGEKNHICAFILSNSNWTYIRLSNFTSSTPQISATSNLTIDKEGKKLYYIGNDNTLHGYSYTTDNLLTNYNYFNFTGNSLFTNLIPTNSEKSLYISKKRDIYLICNIPNLGSQLLKINFSNNSYSSKTILTASPDFPPLKFLSFISNNDIQTIAYIGSDGQAHGITENSLGLKKFNFGGTPSTFAPRSDLFFKGTDELFYTGNDNRIHFYKFEQNYCANSAISTLNNVINSSTELRITKNEDKLQVVPNPNNGYFTLKFNENILIEYINIYDFNGRLIQNVPKYKEGIVEIDISNCASGLYYINCASKTGEVFYKKIILQKQ